MAGVHALLFDMAIKVAGEYVEPEQKGFSIPADRVKSLGKKRK